MDNFVGMWRGVFLALMQLVRDFMTDPKCRVTYLGKYNDLYSAYKMSTHKRSEVRESINKTGEGLRDFVNLPMALSMLISDLLENVESTYAASPKSASPKSASPKSASPKSASPKSASPKSASPKSAITYADLFSEPLILGQKRTGARKKFIIFPKVDTEHVYKGPYVRGEARLEKTLFRYSILKAMSIPFIVEMDTVELVNDKGESEVWIKYENLFGNVWINGEPDKSKLNKDYFEESFSNIKFYTTDTKSGKNLVTMTDYIKKNKIPDEKLVLLVATLSMMYVLSTGDMNPRNIMVSKSGEFYINDFEDDLGRKPGEATEKKMKSFFFNRDSRIFNEATHGLYGKALVVFEEYISRSDEALRGTSISSLKEVPLFEERLKEARFLLKYFADIEG